jgi:hypothetical protein
MNKFLAGLGMLAIVVLTGCASMTTIHTAETLSPGSLNYYVAYVPSSAPLLDTNNDGKADKMDFNTVEVGARIGLTDHIDLGAKLYPVGMLIDGKYQFIKGKMFKAAGDLGAGYMTISSGESKTSIVDIVPEVPLTIRPISWFAFTLAPKSLIRISSSSNDSTKVSSSSTEVLFGTTAGLKFTVKNLGSLIFEYGVFGGSYASNHFAIAVDKPLFGHGTDDE